MQTLRLTLMLCAALTLGACGSESSDDDPAAGPVFSDEAGGGTDSATGNGSPTGQDTNSGDDGDGDDADSGTGEGSTTGQDTNSGGDDTDSGTGDGSTTGQDTGSDGDDTDSATGDGSTTGQDTGSDGDDTDSATSDGSTTGRDTSADGDGTDDGADIGTGEAPDGDRVDAGAEPDIIQPGIPGNLSATRLILGMERVLKATLLDLNIRHASGSPLSEQQQTCLGSYDPALGEPAFAIGCERALATGDVEVYVVQGSLYRTADCTADLAAGTADRCVMESARVIMRTRFAVPPDQEGQGRPRPVPGSGVVVSYAIGAPLLTLESDDQSPLLVFDCAFELQNGALLPSIGGRDFCDAQVRDAADHIDFLSPVVL